LCVLTSVEMRPCVKIYWLFGNSPPELILLVMVFKAGAGLFLNLADVRGLDPPGVMGDYPLT